MTDHSPAAGKMVDIDELEKLAKGATPGEWKVPSDDLHCVESDECHVAECATWSPDDAKDLPAFDREKCWADAAYIAAANPATLLALIAELRAAREVVRMYVDEPKERMEKMRAAGHVFHDEAEQQAIFEQTMDATERDAAIGGEGEK